jgi:hypothetical protein
MRPSGRCASLLLLRALTSVCSWRNCEYRRSTKKGGLVLRSSESGDWSSTLTRYSCKQEKVSQAVHVLVTNR